jgi:hypothetical protein
LFVQRAGHYDILEDIALKGVSGRADRQQRGSRNPRSLDPLAFWRRYSA